MGDAKTVILLRRSSSGTPTVAAGEGSLRRRVSASARVLVCVAATAAAACGARGIPEEQASAMMNTVAERYVKLVLALGQHDPDTVDAYYGPPEWQQELAARPLALEEVRRQAAALVGELDQVRLSPDVDPLVALRHGFLRRQLEALETRAAIVGGRRLAFDEESRALYDAVAPSFDEAYFAGILARLEERLPGRGPLVERWEQYRRAFVIPADRLDHVFRAAIDECRRRTLEQIELPEGERFTVEYVRDKPWSAYNWYRGHYASLIQVNTDLPIFIDRAVDLACHEGYPGHHVYNLVLESRLVRERGWMEYTVYPLFSPQSLIAEGTANFGIEVAFPGDERVAFERATLFPLAGLDPARAAEYAAVRRLVEDLQWADNEAARRYLDGRMDRAAAVAWLERYGLLSPARAEQRVRFIERYRSYVINYTVGRDLVRRHVERHGGTADKPLFRWREFERLIASPRLPSGLRP
jgi:hypothetical protein